TLNPVVSLAHWRLMNSRDPELIRLWLNALAVDVAVIPEKSSREQYHEVAYPEVYRALPLLHDDGEGIRFYGVPRGVDGIVRIVDRARVAAVAPIPADREIETLRAYVAAISTGSRAPDRVERADPDSLRIAASLRAGEAILVQESFDSGWQASPPAVIAKDAAGFMLIHPPPGAGEVRLDYHKPLDQRLGRWVSLAASLVSLALCARPKNTASDRTARDAAR
ncbi:MAG: hypothetical protein ACRD96_17935, partial [Bryobacteraceae bacterium]